MSYYTKKQILQIIAGIGLLVILCFATYREIVGYYFTSMDAFPLLLIGKIDSAGDIGKIFTSPLGGGFPFGSYYRPLSELSYGIDYLIWGKNPMGYHITDILLHLVNSILVFFISAILFKNYKKGLFYAWFSSFLFLISPLNAAIIPSIARRQDMLIALLLCLSLLTFAKVEQTKKNKTAWYLFSLVVGFFAIFSKESAYVLPVLIWLLSFIFNDKDDYRRKTIMATKYSIPFFALALLNTILHLYILGYWDVHVSSSISQHIEAAIKSFFTFAGPLEHLRLSMFSKAIVLIITSLILLFFLVKMVIKHGVNGFLDTILNRERKIYTYLITLILTFIVLFTVSGKSLDFYHYFPNMALTVLMVMVLFDTFNDKRVSIVMKFIGVVFVLYTIVFSPLFTDYSAWRNSSEITRQTIKHTEEILNSDKEASRIYLVNWPGFIGLESEIPGTNATILVNYSMDAWVEWSGLSSQRNVEFIVISCTFFPADDINATFDYTFSDNTIYLKVSKSYITRPKFPKTGDLPFEFIINEDKKSAELKFVRQLNANERIFLYDTDGIRVVGQA